jgi:hypothetical protein
MPNAIPPILIPPSEDPEALRRALQTLLNRLIIHLNQGGSFNDFNMREHRIKNLAWPAELHDAVNVEYLEDALDIFKRKRFAVRNAGSPGALDFKVRQHLPGILEIYDVTVANGGSVDKIHFLIPSIDETNLQYHGTGTFANTTDPYTGLVVINSTNTSRYIQESGLEHIPFGTNSFALINDNTFAASKFGYEAFKITSITGTATASATTTWTVKRVDSEDFLVGTSYFKTKLSAHTDTTNNRNLIFPVEMRREEFAVAPNARDARIPQTASGIRDKYTILIPSRTVIAVVGAAKSEDSFGPWKIVNAISTSSTARTTPAAPGLRINDSGQYTLAINGTCTLSATMPEWISVSHPSNIRSIFGRLARVSTGGSSFVGILETITAATVAYVLYVEPFAGNENSRKVAILGQLSFPDSQQETYLASGAGLPDGRNSPYLGTFPFSRLPVVSIVGSLFDIDKNFTGALPLATTGEYVFFKPDGHLTLVVVQAGSTNAGSTLVAEVQT